MTTQAPDPQWAELRAFVAQAWAQRSPAEQAAFGGAAPDSGEPIVPTRPSDADQPAPALTAATWAPPEAELQLAPAVETFAFPEAARVRPAPRPKPLPAEPIDPEAVAAAADRAERIAALSGAVVPNHLVADLPPPVAREVLSLLAPRFDRTLVDAARNDWSWVLAITRRRAILSALDPAALAETLPLADAVPTDAPGDWLRRAARGDPPAIATLPGTPLPELQVIVQALAWAMPLAPALDETLAAARRATEAAGLLAGYDRLLSGGCIGRESEAARMRNFIADTPARAGGSDPIPVLGLSGIGGAGKSTLLAHVLRPLTERALSDPHAPIVVALDFDRRGFIDGGELEWSFEVTRQIELFAPDCERPLADLRARVRHDRALRGEEGKMVEAALESVHRDAANFEYEAGALLAPARLAERGLLLVLDTFEEWQRSDWNAWNRDAAAARVLEWVSRLASALQVRPGLIVSGRAPADVPGYLAVEPIKLGDLLHGDARALLERLGIPGSRSGKLAKLVGGNPLSLKLAARYIRALPADRRVDLALGDGALPEGLDAALRQGLLYRRFLDHIPDPEVRALAHPGLALRQVTPELIETVLAEPCGLGEIPPERARKLWEKLEAEVWLVERQGDVLTHRADIRRAMLAQMRSDPEQAPRVRAVHAAAADWFTSGQHDPVEAAYHLLSLGAIEDVEDAATVQRLAPCLDDFAPATRAQLRQRLGLRLSAAEAALLPHEQGRSWAAKRAADLVDRGQPGGALRFWRKGGFAPEASPWYVQATFQAVEWNAPVPYGDPGVAELAQGRLAYAYLLAFSRPQETLRRADLEALDALARAQLRSGQARPIDEVLLENFYFQRVTTGRIMDDGTGPLAGKLELSAAGLAGVDIRRLAAVVPDPSAFERFDTRRILALSFRPSLCWLMGLSARLRASGGDTARLDAFRAELEQGAARGTAPTVAELLANHNDRFCEAVRAAFRVMPPPLTLIDLLGRRGDDPEWRVPIRETLASGLAEPGAFRPFAERAAAVFDLLPSDLTAPALIAEHRRAPRGMWLRLVEFADRAGVLTGLLAAAGASGDRKVARVASAYARWNTASERLLGEREDRTPTTSPRRTDVTDTRPGATTLDEAVDRIDALLGPDVTADATDALEDAGDWGHYEGTPPTITLLPDGRNATLHSAIAYHQADATHWPVPAGAALDGASIPRAFWTLIGGPFEGQYRDASIVHDHYCVTQDRPWADVHRMFYDAMRCSGVGKRKAGVMYYAVQRFGPRWPDPSGESVESVTAEHQPDDRDAEGLVEDAQAIVERNLGPEAIAKLARKREAQSDQGVTP